MTKLSDKEIRLALVSYLTNLPNKPSKIIEELRVYNGNAIADVVALYEDTHCFEIKSDLDRIERIEKQGAYYDLSFLNVTLVTTNKFIKKAIEIAPAHWGILLASVSENGVMISSIRTSKRNKYFDKRSALLTLWKSEMLEIADFDLSKKKYQSRDELSKLIARRKSDSELSRHICKLLQFRKAVDWNYA